MIERVSDTEFCTYMTQSLLDPIGMPHSSYKLNPATLPDTWGTAPGSYKIINPDPQGTPEAIRLSNKGAFLNSAIKSPGGIPKQENFI
jgi:CubicO group peptidase (beta-lactamase class C family)